MKRFQKVLCFLVLTVLVSFKTSYDLLTKNNESLHQQKRESCGRYPQQEHIFTDNIIWQVLETPHGFIYLLNAYLDTRWNKTVVKVNLNSNPLNKTTHKLFCQFWFDEGSQPVVVQATEFQSMFVNSKFIFLKIVF